MKAFHGKQSVKDFYLKRVHAHAKADEIVHGYYWRDGKGCAVGCTIHGHSHSDYEAELGIPQMLVRLEDKIFEGMLNSDSKKFPKQFLSAIKPGADLSRVGWKFLHWLLTESHIGNFDHPLVCNAVKECADVLVPLTKGKPVDESAARSAARSAERSAARAESAAYKKMRNKLLSFLKAA